MSAVRLVPGEEDGGAKKAGQEDPSGNDHRDDDDEDEGSRGVTNIIIGVAVVAVIAIGIWLVNALLEQRRIDECMARGQRNCGRIEVPAR